jgi:hypothetical protein
MNPDGDKSDIVCSATSVGGVPAYASGLGFGPN